VIDRKSTEAREIADTPDLPGCAWHQAGEGAMRNRPGARGPAARGLPEPGPRRARHHAKPAQRSRHLQVGPGGTTRTVPTAMALPADLTDTKSAIRAPT
jgi:hypothetical protein